MKVFLSVLLLGAVFAKYEVPDPKEKTTAYWMSNMKKELMDAVELERNMKVAKNIILFVGDGMGITATTAGRIHKGQKQGFTGEEHSLVWENFPHNSLIKTYNLDKQVPDSAATASAFVTGSKTNYFTVGCTPDVVMYDYISALDEKNWGSSVAQWGQEAGKHTGVVTTTRVTDATPSSLYAHTSFRYWQCDTEMNQTVRDSGTKDIARQLVEGDVGKNFKVIMGGGRSFLGAPLPEDEPSCVRTDQRDLTAEWLKEKEEQGATAKYVTNTEQFMDIDIDNTDYIMGLFADSHTPFEAERDTSTEGTPSIVEMTKTAIKLLQKSENGFVLMVEGGRVDNALHMSRPFLALEEISALDDAVQAALELVDIEDTLIIVTADHSHVMTFNGYPERGNDILGTVTYKDTEDKLPYPTLMFTVGPGFDGTFTWNGSKVVRNDISERDTTDHGWVSPSIVKTNDDYYAVHGGEDIATYAIGPMSHLFHKVHEQPYIAHVMSYAGCIGPYAEDCNRSTRETPKPMSKFLRN